MEELKEQLKNMVLDRKDLLSLYDSGYNLLPSGRARILALFQNWLNKELDGLEVISDEEMEQLMTYGFIDPPIPILHVEKIAQAQLDDTKKRLAERIKGEK